MTPSGKALQRPRETFDIRAANGFSMQLLEVVDVLNFRNGCLQSLGKLPETNLQYLDHVFLASSTQTLAQALAYSLVYSLVYSFLASFLADLFCECHGGFLNFGLLDCLHLTAECCHVNAPREKVAKHQVEGIPGDLCEQGLIPDVFAQQFPAHIGFQYPQNENALRRASDFLERQF